MRRVAVIGAGVAGSRCAHLVARAGHAVTVFDKARGAGGRLATRRLPWGEALMGFDHGAAGFAGPEPGQDAPLGWQEDFVDPLTAQGLLVPWHARRPDGSSAPAQWRVNPPQPRACQALLGALPLHTSHTLHGLSRHDGAWTLHWAEAEAPATAHPGFDAVVLAMPPAQAAALLGTVSPSMPGVADGAALAAGTPMAPCWTLMLVTDALPSAWDLLQPADGPLQQVVRQEGRWGPLAAGLGLWVLHARAGWSQTHLEDDASAVQAALTDAWAAALRAAGEAVPAVRQATVHRWRYAQADAQGPAPGAWWQPGVGLGLCGDWLGGGGVLGAWRSGTALAQALTAA